MKNVLPFLMVLVMLVLATSTVEAQCAMCSKTAMDAMKDGNTASLGLNNAILYLLIMPYVLAVSIGGTWWWRRRKWSRIEEMG